MPAREDCVESFQWLAQEVWQAGGQALAMHVQKFEGLTDQELISLFRSARQEDYASLLRETEDLEKALNKDVEPAAWSQVQDTLTRLRRQFAEVSRIDYFNCPERAMVEAQLGRVAEALCPGAAPDPEIRAAAVDEYRDKCWVTRPQPHVDRLACAWLIRRFINPEASIRYSLQPGPAEVPFDMSGAEFGHQGNLCTFETMLRAFSLEGPELQTLAEIVHEIDLRDGRYLRPEVAGVDAVLNGWLSLNLPDAEIERRGLALFDGLHGAISGQHGATSED